MKKQTVIAGVLVAAVAAGGGAIAVAGGGEDSADTPITGAALERASGIALDQTGGGRVTGSEIRDEEGYYEIEVTKPDGSHVDVHLDRNFNVIDTARDSESSDGVEER